MQLGLNGPNKEQNVAQMIRKQVYISRRHQALLTQLAQARGVSEAEVIRQAIEHEATSGISQSHLSDTTALEEVVTDALSRRQIGVDGEPYRWNREDIYAERGERYGNDLALS
jgi:hypothetical protein